MLQELAAHVYDARAPFGAGHHMDLDGMLEEGAPAVEALAFARDPELGAIGTPNGALTFLQAVGLRADEEALVTRWSVNAFLGALADVSPLLISQRDRPSLLADPDRAAQLLRRADDEGSAQTTAFAETLSWRSPFWSSRKLELFLGPIEAARRSLPSMLAGRTRLGREFRIVGPEGHCLVRAGAAAAWNVTDAGAASALELVVPPALARELQQFLAGDGLVLQSTSLPGLTVRLID